MEVDGEEEYKKETWKKIEVLEKKVMEWMKVMLSLLQRFDKKMEMINIFSV